MQSAVMIGDQSLLIECAKLWQSSGHEIAQIITQSAEIADWASDLSIAVECYEGNLSSVSMPAAFDWLLSIANLQIIPDAHIERAQKGAVNFHDGPLPSYAGLNAPVWARMNGESAHGVTWHMIEGGVDEGDILVRRHFDIRDSDTALTLNTKCFEAAIDSFPDVIAALQSPVLPREPQDLAKRSYFGLTDRPDAGGRLDFTKSAAEVVNLVRALDHGTYFNPLSLPKVLIDGKLVCLVSATEISGKGQPGKVLAADQTSLTVACGDGAVKLGGLQHINGEAFHGENLVGQALASPQNAHAINAALKQVAAHEPFWRKALAGYMPAKLPLTLHSDEPANWKTAAVAAPEGMTLAQKVAAVAVFASKSGAEPGCGFAFHHAEQTSFAGHLADWVPLTLCAVDDLSVSDFVEETRTTLDTVIAKNGFASDLVLRAPELTPLGTPDLAIVADPDAGPLSGSAINIMLGERDMRLRFDENRIAASHAKVLAARLELAVEAICSGSGSLGEIDILPKTERELLLNGWPGADVELDIQETIHGAIAKQVEQTPEATALVFEHQSLSYAELDARANRCAQVLQRRGVKTGDIVGIHCRRSLDLVVACLGTMKAGAAYLPLDPAFPADRIAMYLEDSAAKFVISQADIAGALPSNSAEVLLIDQADEFGTAAASAPESGAVGSDLAYLIFTSGSTGRPKGVMVEHGNVINFFAGMDDRIASDGPATWLAVTSLSFDISVLELFYTLSRGHKVVISGDESATQISDGPIGTDGQGMEFSLYYWGNDDGVGRDKYRLLLEGARYADENGFCAVWTPERHFHAFGGPYPNPSVTGAAVAGATKNIGVRAGSCVAPLHHTARIAEEWAVIDNLTNGRAGLAIASGWQPDDFVLRPENTPPANKAAMFQQIGDLRKLWSGEAVEFPRADGSPHAVVTQPRPVSKELDIWVTTAGNPETWIEAGRNGAHILTHLLGQSVDEVADKIKLYHKALREAGYRPDDFKVTLMLHTFVAEDRERAREIAREPMKDYLRSAAGLIKQYAWAFPAFKKPEGVNNPFELDLGSLSEDELEGILDFAFLRYFEDSGLFGTVGDCLERVESLKRIGVSEVACLIDYGIDTDTVLAGLRPLTEVVEACRGGEAVSEDDVSIAGQVIRHGVTHLQCTPSMARLLTMNDEAARALRQVKHLFLGGEALPGALVAELGQLTDASITNMYGPTETTIWSSTASAVGHETTVNIGRPITNTSMFVVDAKMRPVPFGVAGELMIGGAGVVRGYWGRDELTKERFVDNPFGAGRLYRTGDLVSRRMDGAFDYVGRADFQVKLRGYRIELGEIESHLEALSDVRQAVVVTREDTPGDVRLVAYVVGAASETDMREQLIGNVPGYMVPSHFVRLEAFPLTPNKKIDRKALPAPARQAVNAITPEPETLDQRSDGSIERQIADLWSRILGIEGISASDNFFDLGGHSLLAVQAHREMRDRLGFKAVSITDIFRFPTLAGLAGRIEATCGPVTELGKTAELQPPTNAAQQNPKQEQQTTRQDAMAKRRAMRARRREKLS